VIKELLKKYLGMISFGEELFCNPLCLKRKVAPSNELERMARNVWP